MIQVPGWLDAGPDVVSQVLGCSDVGPCYDARESSSTFGKINVIVWICG